MCIFEYDQEKHIDMEREEWKNKGIEIGREERLKAGRQEGIEAGRQAGQEETLVKSIESLMRSFKLSLPDACRALQITVSEYENFKKQMMER
ncbi:MAG: hypothetical protein NC318_11790 [Blautia sp.]|nr:hypothetical protein [Lachnoclostridium sp.]MCM1212276.1 hypothetical protein [Blautia sp.]